MKDWCESIERRLENCEPVYVFEFYDKDGEWFFPRRCGDDFMKHYPRINDALIKINNTLRSPRKSDIEEICTIDLSHCGDGDVKPKRRGTIFRRRRTSS